MPSASWLALRVRHTSSSPGGLCLLYVHTSEPPAVRVSGLALMPMCGKRRSRFTSSNVADEIGSTASISGTITRTTMKEP